VKKIYVVLLCGFLGVILMLAATPRQVSAQAEITNASLVNALRLLNTQEYTYQHDNARFATQQELLSFLRTKGNLGKSAIDLENPKPYELIITTSPDKQHYQIGLRRPSGPNDGNAGCRSAAFSDDGGVIYLGLALGCESSTR